MASIAVLTGNHLCNNPRVMKEAATLRRAGHAVTVFGAWSDPLLKRRDQHLIDRLGVEFEAVADSTAFSPRMLLRRAQTRLANLVHAHVGVESVWQFGPTVRGLRRAAARNGTDLVICHSEAALAAVSPLTHMVRPVAIDMEDWFSEDLLPHVRGTRPGRTLRALERSALRSAVYSTCTSAAMRDALMREYECPAPRVIYNAFEWAGRETLDNLKKDRTSDLPSIHWFSQTVGPGRGLEDLFAALPLLDTPAAVHLRGRPVHGFSKWLHDRVQGVWRDRIHVHEPVDPDELLSRIAEHDIGFAGEMLFCRSRDLTVTNKILHYLLGGLAVIASDTAGQREIAAKAPGAIALYPSGDPRALADRLNSLMREPARLAAGKHAALWAAREVLCWEIQAPVLLAAVEKALA